MARKPNVICSCCSKSVYRRPSTLKKFKNVFCKACICERNKVAAQIRGKQGHNKVVAAWLEGSFDGCVGNGQTLSRSIRKYLINEAKKTCVLFAVGEKQIFLLI